MEKNSRRSGSAVMRLEMSTQGSLSREGLTTIRLCTPIRAVADVNPPVTSQRRRIRERLRATRKFAGVRFLSRMHSRVDCKGRALQTKVNTDHVESLSSEYERDGTHLDEPFPTTLMLANERSLPRVYPLVSLQVTSPRKGFATFRLITDVDPRVPRRCHTDAFYTGIATSIPFIIFVALIAISFRSRWCA